MTTILIAASLVGCKRPPEAPTELSELAGFIFERFPDEDTEELALGIENLEIWLRKNIEDTEDGYTVNNLKPSVIESVIPDREHNLENLGGASVAYLLESDVRPIARALVLDEQEEVFPKAYEVHDREYLTDPDCFMPHDCDFVDTDNRVEANYVIVKVSTHSQAQYRWVEYGDPAEYALVHRTWLVEPAEASMDSVQIHEQLYVGVTFPWNKQSTVRVGTTWISADILDGLVSEGMALQMMIDAMKGEAKDLDKYLSEE